MNNKALWQKQILIFLTIFVSVYKLYAADSKQCSKIFYYPDNPKVSSSEENKALFLKNRELTKAFIDKNKKFKIYLDSLFGKTIDQNELQSKISFIQKITDDYFKSNGILFRKESIVRTGTQLNSNLPITEIKYDLYYIEGIDPNFEGKNLNRDLLNGILISSQNKKIPDWIKLVYDPFLGLDKPLVLAFYSFENNSIFFSYDSLANPYLGDRNNLRHEFRHALEDQKLRAKEKTLASISFSSPTQKSKKELTGYNDFLRGDELETHIRDIRYLTVIAPRVEALMPYEEAILQKQQRLQILHIITGGTEQLLKRLKSSIFTLKEIYNNNAYENSTSSLDIVRLLWETTFNKTNNEYYGTIQITISREGNFHKSFKEYIGWLEKRIEQIENELQSLKKLKNQI